MSSHGRVTAEQVEALDDRIEVGVAGVRDAHSNPQQLADELTSRWRQAETASWIELRASEGDLQSLHAAILLGQASAVHAAELADELVTLMTHVERTDRDVRLGWAGSVEFDLGR